ncbi:hypothetical protein GL263_14185 [Streptomyces durbertensis]|uniref:DUF892 family protein n=1 Tax=Streptomyces durbertensis TaxID=2448886 RepID=A0ABR6EHA0_9ACTN|nr:hypothetical protein [Streptomyces durbertensis]MBB1244706.1 hypothetical protein [Streptomyces durbertensis]
MTHHTDPRHPGAEDERERREPRSRSLTVYLNNHLMGATAGVRLLERLERQQEDEGVSAELARLAEEIDEDRATLLRLMRELDVPVRRSMIVAGRLGETLGRFKPNGRLMRDTEVRAVLEFEAMTLGVQGKASLWRALAELPEAHEGRWPDLLRELLERADRQAETLEALRLAVVRKALTPG